jgi:hypothetical protein
MDINCLLIDDEYDKRTLDALKDDLQYEVNKNSKVSKKIILRYEDPLKYLGKELNYDSLFEYLNATYLSQKLDLLLCDFNLHAHHKHIAFHIINHVRKKNKACSIILFSGSPLKELIRINNNDLATKLSEHITGDNPKAEVEPLKKKLEELRKEEEPAEELMEIAVKSNISSIVSRTKYEEEAMKLIVNPSEILWLENELLKNGDLIFNDGDQKLNGLKLTEVAKHIREQTDLGLYFTKEIMKLAIASLIEFNQ